MRLEAQRSALLLVDVQERLTPVMHDPRRVLHHGSLLLRAARRLEIPVLASEQYPKGLGPTMVDLRQDLPQDAVCPKNSFSCCGDDTLMSRVRGLERDQVVIAGIEAHVCVLQTALDMKTAGFGVCVVRDACSARNPDHEDVAWARLLQAGVTVAVTEMVLFEWLGRAGTEAFKEISAWIK